MKFRTDINGLRTYAVLAVIIFHFNKSWLPGGFAGVDVFFVISGYLMTSIIFRGLEKQSFSLWKFYSARIRRIIPALLVLIIILMIFGYLFLAPIPYSDLAKHSGGSLLFISNIMYWQESGYFDAAAIEKFLLHTWSLSVEWQFYMIYPLGLLILSKILKIETLKKLVVIGTILSLIFAIYASQRWSVASYFLLPTRVWEMMLGGVAFLYPFELRKQSEKHMLELSGLALIVVSFFIINENISWPGYAALVPTLGTFILLQANNDKSIFTNNPIAQKIGLWSYSLYLYHWPILVINHKFDLSLSLWLFLIFTFILSILSYYLIEIRRWKVSHVLIASFVVLASIYTIYATKGASFRVDSKFSLTASEFHQEYYGGSGYPTHQESYINTTLDKQYDYFVMGDSFARQYASFIDNNNLKARTWFGDWCLFLARHTNTSENKKFEKCSIESNAVHKEIIGLIDKPIIWMQSWDNYNIVSKESDNPNGISQNKNPEKYKKIINDEIKSVAAKSLMVGSNVYIVGVYTKPTYNTYECLSSQTLLSFKLQEHQCPKTTPRKEDPINKELMKISDQNINVFYINPNEAFCNDDECDIITDSNEPIFSDMGHLSKVGANIVGKYIFDQVQAIEMNSE